MSVAISVDPIDSTIRKAKAILVANRPLTLAEETETSAALERAVPGTLEWVELRSILDVFAKRSRDASMALLVNLQVEAANKRAAHVAARPQRWAALSPEVRVCLLMAAKFGGDVRGAFLELAKLVGQDTASMEPPESTFEPEIW